VETLLGLEAELLDLPLLLAELGLLVDELLSLD